MAKKGGAQKEGLCLRVFSKAGLDSDWFSVYGSTNLRRVFVCVGPDKRAAKKGKQSTNNTPRLCTAFECSCTTWRWPNAVPVSCKGACPHVYHVPLWMNRHNKQSFVCGCEENEEADHKVLKEEVVKVEVVVCTDCEPPPSGTLREAYPRCTHNRDTTQWR